MDSIEFKIHHRPRPLTFFSQALLESVAQPSERAGTGRGDSDASEHQIRALSKAAVDLAVETRVLGRDRRDGGDESGGGGGCVSEEVVREEVDVAIGKLMADGTGMRDYANAALGGTVVRRDASWFASPQRSIHSQATDTFRARSGHIGPKGQRNTT